MSYSSSQIVAAFNDGNNTANWGARSYSSDGLDQVHFTVPSNLIKVTYDCFDNVFYIKFEKYVGSWGNYVQAICKTVHHILKTLQAGGLDVNAPDSPDHMQIVIAPAKNGLTFVQIQPL